MRQSTLRLHSVRWKGGGQLRVLPQLPDKRAEILQRLRPILAAHDTTVSGYAFVIWSPDGASSAFYCSGTPFHPMQVPDFVRERLMAEAILAWTE